MNKLPMMVTFLYIDFGVFVFIYIDTMVSSLVTLRLLSAYAFIIEDRSIFGFVFPPNIHIHSHAIFFSITVEGQYKAATI